MSFGGSAAAMISSLKNNKRNCVSTFKKIENYKNGNYSELQFDKKATPKQLHQIREKIKSENKKSFRKKVILMAVFLIVVIYFIL